MRFLLTGAITCAYLTAAMLPGHAFANIARMELEGAINPITAEFVIDGIEQAESDSAELLLIRIHTPGGLATSMEAIISRMLGSKVPIVVYVAPSGAKAASAGFFILLAADVAAMAPGTNTGAAHPLMAIGGFPVDGGEAGKALAEKVTSNAMAFLRSIASKRNRNIEEAEKGVRESKSFTDSEALEHNLVDLVAPSEVELLARLEGYKVRLFSGHEKELRTQGLSIVEYKMTTRQRFLSTLTQPNLALLLGLVGVILLFFEFSNPGFIAPGVIGGICLLLAILGFSFLPINFVGVLLVLLAIGLFVAEVKIQGFGILGFGGVAAMIFGLLILVDTPDPAVGIGSWTAFSVAFPFGVIFTILLVAMFRSFGQPVATGAEGMIGLIGATDSEIHLQGRVKIRGEHWNARSSSAIAPGRAVRVVAVTDLVLVVEETPEPSQSSQSSQEEPSP